MAVPQDSLTSHEHCAVEAVSPSPFPPRPHISVEMTDLNDEGRTGAGTSGLLNDISIPSTSPIGTSFPTSSDPPLPPSDDEKPRDAAAGSTAHASPGQPLSSQRMEEREAPLAAQTAGATDSQVTSGEGEQKSPDITAVLSATPYTPPVLNITLMLTTGARHPYKIDEKYLFKRNVNVPGTMENGRKDPASISVYTLKELILREWREEWEAQPSSPSSIRLIYFGRLLDDKVALRECSLRADVPNIVHMTVRPQDMIDEEDGGKGKAMGRDRNGGESTAGCRCVIL